MWGFQRMELTKQERVTVLALMSIAIQQMRALHHYKTIDVCKTCGHETIIPIYNLPNRDDYKKLVKKLKDTDIEWGDIEEEKWCAKKIVCNATFNNMFRGEKPNSSHD